jgi:hypothetical protein
MKDINPADYQCAPISTGGASSSRLSGGGENDQQPTRKKQESTTRSAALGKVLGTKGPAGRISRRAVLSEVFSSSVSNHCEISIAKRPKIPGRDNRAKAQFVEVLER